jgi:hypothetical protein
MNLSLFLRSERRVLTVVGLTFLPWFGVCLFVAGSWVALHIVVYAILLFAVGYGVVSAALPSQIRGQAIVLTPAVGILVIAGLTAFWLRLGLQLPSASILWIGLTAIGVRILWMDRDLLQQTTVEYGFVLVILSGLVCAVYFVPGALRDAVSRSDGSFNWIYIDDQYHHSVAASIKYSNGPPKMPATSTSELLYHFGPYAPAAAISRLTGLDLGDALVRVTNGASIWALVLSCFGLGTLLSVKANGEKFGGIMSVAGFFFYGSLLSLFVSDVVLSGRGSGFILFKLPGLFLFDGDALLGSTRKVPFNHLILGHSVLHGSIAITAIMGLCLVQRLGGVVMSWHQLILLALPALAVAVHPVAALYCLSVVGILLFWGRLQDARTWVFVAMMFVVFLGTWKIMDYNHAPHAAGAMLRHNLASKWWTLVTWFLFDLGFRIMAFGWISRSLKDPLSMMVLVSVLGLMSFTLLIQLHDENERYGLYFLQSIFSIFAFCRLPSSFWRSDKRNKLVAEWLELGKKGTLLLAIAGLFIGIVGYATHGFSGISYFRLTMLLVFLLLLFMAVMSMLVNRGRCLAMGSSILTGVLLIGFLGWLAPWINYGLGRAHRDVRLAPGEVRGLKRLNELAAQDELFATNKHFGQHLLKKDIPDYAYGALSERPALLGGYLTANESALTGFDTLHRENDLLFTTKDPEVLSSIAQNYRVKWLIAQPGTDIALPRPLQTGSSSKPTVGP